MESMTLQVRRLIIHQLEKEADEAEARIFLSEGVVPTDERARALLEKLNGTFSSKSEVLQGYLSPPEDALFPGYFQVLIDGGLTEEAFVQFSKDTMQALQLALQGVAGAKGGYLVYADYSWMEMRRLGIFLVRDTEGVIFRRLAGRSAFELDTVTYLNVDRLAMACCLHVDKFLQGGGRFVELIKHARSQKEISEYFINWIGLERTESSRELTTTFLEVVSHLPLPVDEATGTPMEEGQFREKVTQFALRSPRQTIELDKFDAHFYGNEQPTRQYLQANDIELEEEFRFDDGQLRRFYQCRAYAEGIALSFNRRHYQTRQVEIEGDAVVIRSAALVEKLLAMLEDE